ncbi:hypothetical protein [Streptomyces globosus]|uniref:hypothetical protein n=1 Tax=Streptomyces globosus TaxID=68209 RepID=UPI00364122E5
MRILARRLLLPGLTTLALTATGCSSAPQPPAAPPTSLGLPAAPAPVADGTQQLEVAAAPQDEPSAGMARVGAGKGTPEKAALKVASFDKATGKAVIAPAAPKAPAPPKDPKGSAPAQNTPSPGASPSGSAAPDKAVAVGDVIASAPVPGAPDGLLAKVTEVGRKTERGTEVKTAPTTLSAVLNDDKADGKVPVDPSTVTVEPLMKGVTFSWAKGQGLKFGPEGAKLPLGNLRLDVHAPIETAAGAPSPRAPRCPGSSSSRPPSSSRTTGPAAPARAARSSA